MTTYIKKPTEVASEVTGASHLDSYSGLRIPAKQGRHWATYRIIGVMAIPGLGLVLSVLSDYLFFKELLLATAIIGMAMLLKTARHPAILISKEDCGRAHLN